MWIETKLQFVRRTDNGKVKKVTETYMVDALSFTEAEARITEEARVFVVGDFTVSAVKKTNVAEIFDKYEGDRWYAVKAGFISLDEKTGVEKVNNVDYLVSANDFNDAVDNFTDAMKGTLADYDIIGINETAILDAFYAETK